MSLLLQHWLEATADSFPENEAVTGAGISFRYRELDKLSSRIARLLGGCGFHRRDRAIIILERSPWVLALIYAVLKADGVYVPLDSKTPGKRLSLVIEDCAPKVIFCGKSMIPTIGALLANMRPAPLLATIDTEAEPDQEVAGLGSLKDASDQPRRWRNISHDPAYIIYTSGSSGRPKGVAVSHANVRNYIDWAVKRLAITHEDRILGTAPFSFDMSVFDLFCPIRTGATLCMCTEKDCMFPSQLVKRIDGFGATIWKGVSSLIGYLAWSRIVQPGVMPTLRLVLFGGELLPVKHLAAWMNVLPEKKYFNCYGPTESTGVSVFHEIEKSPKPSEESIPIGRPIDNMEAVIIDDQGKETEDGTAGELLLRGGSVGLGYWGDPSLTEERFIFRNDDNSVPTRFYKTGDRVLVDKDGQLLFLGRVDTQVKYMGYRIDLQEIERALHSIDDVSDAAAALKTSSADGKQQLVALVECNGNQPDAGFAAQLHKSLPPYMIPKTIVACETLPRNSRGKVDRAAVSALLDEPGGLTT